jgi:hypothetical protein
MEPYFSLHKCKSNKPYPIRILKVDNICINEDYIMSLSQTPLPAPVETHTLSISEKADLDILFESYRVYIAAKLAYEAAVKTFWKSSIGAKFETILAPDPPACERAPLFEKTKVLETFIASACIQIKNQQVDVSGYNYVVVSYILLMYETQTLPQNYNDFVLHTINERILVEIPKVWTNKMVIPLKKVVKCVYVYGHVLPPYRLKDMQ